MEAVVCHNELYSIPFYPYIFIQQALQPLSHLSISIAIILND